MLTDPKPAPAPYNLHLVSDSSGETVTNIARACLVQYEGTPVSEHSWWLIRTAGQMGRVIEGIRQSPGLVIYTLLDSEVRVLLEKACRELKIPAVSALDPVMQALGRYFKREASSEIGRQHVMDDGYFQRIDAMHFAMQHDDGQSMATMTEADVILIGVSRTSKTPTCMYLANRGYKVANIPLVPGLVLPDEIVHAAKPLIVGLTREPKSLSDIRQSRLRIMNDTRGENYANIDNVREEVAESRRLFTKHGWPVIDVTRRSIEETAATIIQLHHQRHAAT
ncbi:MAG: pyruvate, water dikinase regulatory protein [Rhodospirillaceae bacterium]|nr:pyruvate, water dikinase regulatory protein [Rhodospirillaceae bacterium]